MAAFAPQPQPAVAERRLVSVLFCDLVDFTVLSESRDPEEVRDLLGKYFELAREVVGRYGGTIEKFIGDAVMAVWGAPVAHEDDAERAVRAALDLVQAVAGLQGANGGPLQLRAGVLTGEAAVTLGAAGQGMVAGDLVNTASRLQSVAPPGSVLVGESTYRAASRAIAFEAVGEQAVKGKRLPVAAWTALRVVAERGGVGRSEQLEPPFVGRDTELRLIKDLLHATGRERKARLISITGQAGIGKSRLAWEFLKYIDGLVEPIYWHQGRSPAYGEATAYWALGEMVRRRARIAETDDSRTTRERVAESVREYVTDDAERRWIEARLLALLGADDVPEGGREELFAAWRTFFERVAEHGTVVMVFEDLHWADTGLLDFIDHVLDWSRSHPILIVTLARPELLERRPDWGAGRRNFVGLSLEPLAESEMRSLLAGLVPGLPETTVRTILARAEGVPLYCVETVRMLLHEGRLEVVDGAYRPVGDFAHLQIPDSLHAVIAARLDSAEAPERSLLQDAAVLGQSFTVAGLAAICGEQPDVLEPRLRALVRRELLTLESDPRSPERGQYRFVQSLIREVAYNTLAKRDRRSRHLAAARFYEGLGEEELSGALASHYLDAYRAQPEGPEGDAVAVQARLALKAAADRAAALGSHTQAVAYLEEALTVARDRAEEAELLLRAGEAALSAGHYERAESFLTGAGQRYRELHDQVGAARVTTQLAFVLLSTGRVEEAVVTAQAGLAELHDVGTEPALAELTAAVAHAYMRSSEYERAIEWADRALAAAERLGLVRVTGEALITRATALGGIGRFQEATVVLEGVARLARARGLTRTELRAIINLAFTIIPDDPRAGLESARTGLDLAQRLGEQSFIAMLVGNAVEATFLTGEWDWGLKALQGYESIDLEPVDRTLMESSGLFIRACRGELSARDLERFDILAGVSDPQITVTVSAVRAWAALAAGRLHEARRHAFAAVSSQFAGDAYLLAARASFWLRDLDGARSAQAGLDAQRARGRVVEASRRTVDAGVAVLGKEAHGREAYRDAMRSWRELELGFPLALCQLDFVTLLGPDDPDARAAAADARDTFERLGARPFVARLDQALAEAGAEPRSPQLQEAEST